MCKPRRPGGARKLFDGHRRPPVAGRKVIVVDDGIATGATAIAAVRSMIAAGASRVVMAAPVASPERADMLRDEADDVVCLIEDPRLYAVGQYYVDFREVADEEVKQALDAFGQETTRVRRKGAAQRAAG